MGWLSLLTGGLSSAITGIITPWFAHEDNADKITLEGFKTATGSDEKAYEAWVSYRLQQQSLHAAETAWWGPKLCLMIVALPACIHVGLVYVDSWFGNGLPLIGHLYPARLPPDYFVFEQRVIEWLFGAAVAGPAVSAAAAWLHRR